MDALSCKTSDHDGLRTAFINAATLEIENCFSIDLADRCAMETAHVVISNLQLGLRVDLSLFRQQQIFAVLDGVGFLRMLMNSNGAVKHTDRVPSEHPLKQFAA